MTYEEFWRPLMQIYDQGEAKALAQLVFELRFGLTLADTLCGRTGDEDDLHQIQGRLLQGEPVQYVLGLAEFGPFVFHVRPGVLIPRPETYELCQWCLPSSTHDWKGSILDIGTGSGCIACTLAALLPQAQVTAWDISESALSIARENAEHTHVNVSFEQVDALNIPPLTTIRWDIIVSNPPYICEQERTTMERNVLDYEPKEALFVPDEDPLLFYRTISDYALETLNPSGTLFFEINPLYAEALRKHLEAKGFCVEQREDQFGKIRFIKAIRP